MKQDFLYRFVEKLPQKRIKEFRAHVLVMNALKQPHYVDLLDKIIQGVDTIDLVSQFHNFQRVKNYLQNALLDFLIGKDGAKDQLKNKIRKAELLIEFNMYDDALYFFDKALQISLENEDFKTSIDICTKIVECTYKTPLDSYIRSKKMVYLQVIDQVLEKLSNFNTLYALSHVIIQQSLNTIEDIKSLQKLEIDLLNLTPKSNKAKLQYERSCFFLAILKNDYPHMIHHMKMMIELLEQKTTIFEFNTKRLLIARSNLMVLYLQTKNYSIAQQEFSLLKKIYHKNKLNVYEEELLEYMLNLSDQVLKLYTFSREILKGLKPKIISTKYWMILEKYADSEDHYFNLMILLLQEDYKSVNRYISRFFNVLFKTINQKIEILLIEIIVYIELEYQNQVEYKIENLKYIKRTTNINNCLHGILEYFILNYNTIKSLNKVSKNDEMRKILEEKNQESNYCIFQNNQPFWMIYLNSKIKLQAPIELYYELYRC